MSATRTSRPFTRPPRISAPFQDSLPIDLPHYVRAHNGISHKRLPPVVPGIFDLVLEFHRAFGLTRNSEPTLDVSTQVATLRLKLLAEESGELEDAMREGDLIGIADALADITYVIFGTAATYGIDLEAVVREVHLSNMSKLDEHGEPIFREDGKVRKSRSYVPPDINTVLALQPPLF